MFGGNKKGKEEDTAFTMFTVFYPLVLCHVWGIVNISRSDNLNVPVLYKTLELEKITDVTINV